MEALPHLYLYLYLRYHHAQQHTASHDETPGAGDERAPEGRQTRRQAGRDGMLLCVCKPLCGMVNRAWCVC